MALGSFNVNSQVVVLSFFPFLFILMPFYHKDIMSQNWCHFYIETFYYIMMFEWNWFDIHLINIKIMSIGFDITLMHIYLTLEWFHIIVIETRSIDSMSFQQW